MQALNETITSLGQVRATCPCGCGVVSTDEHLVRSRLLTDQSGKIANQIETMKSYDGGSSWHDKTWMPA